VKDTMATACVALWREPVSGDGPHPATRLNPWDAAQFIMDAWDRQKLLFAPQLARVVILRVALQVQYPNPGQGERALAWACTEAPYWWDALDGQPVKREHLAALWQQYRDHGRA